MGMDLKPIKPTKDAPRGEDGVVWGRYNWNGWCLLQEMLSGWGVDTSQFAHSNDGAKISAEACGKIADAIEARLPEMTERDRRWLEPHIARWRNCGGYEQW